MQANHILTKLSNGICESNSMSRIVGSDLSMANLPISIGEQVAIGDRLSGDI